MKVKNRERIHSLFSIALSLSLVLTPLPVHATDTGGTDAGADTGSSPTTIDVSANGSEETSVYAEIGSHYEITIPKSITLDGEQKTGSYSVAVVGDIPGSQVVSVVPDTSFTMSSHKIDDATALATQDKTLWRYSDMLPTDPVVAAGEIDATAISAGEWDGKLNFNTELREHDCDSDSSPTTMTTDVPWVNTSNGTYQFIQNGTTWTSNNKAMKSSSATSTWTIDLEEDTEYSFKYKVSSEPDYDRLSIVLDGTYIIDSISGAGSEETYTTTLTAGSHTLTAYYNKNRSGDENEDKAYIVLEDAAVAVPGHTCDICGTPGVHSYSSTITTEPTCTETGIKTFTCACGSSYTTVISALGHDYDDGVITTEPTCTSVGIKTYTCTRCGASYTEEISVAHTAVDGICTVCGERVPGLYNEYGVMTASWDELLDDDIISVYDGMFQSKPDGWGAHINTSADYLVGRLVIADDVTSLSSYALYVCPGLVDVDIPDSVTSIGQSAFEGCTSLTSIEIPDSVTNIETDAFSDSGLTSITIPASVTSISSTAFSNMSNLTSLTVDPANTVYDSRDNCNAVIETETNTLVAGTQNTVIPDSVTSIKGYAFHDCASLTNISIPDGVTYIDDFTFNDCTSLTSVVIPDGVTGINNNAFTNCSSLTSVIIPDSVTEITHGAFSYCGSFTIYYEGTEDQWNAITIDKYAFSNSTPTIIYNSAETHIHSYSSTVTTEPTCSSEGVRTYTCSECGDSYTEQIGTLAHTDADENEICDICGATIKYTAFTLTNSNYTQAGITSRSGNVVIPKTFIYNGVNYKITTIDWRAFLGCSKLTSVDIPNSVTTIGGAAFSGCTSLTSIVIPDSVTTINGDSDKLYGGAFANSGLTSINIPASVTYIDYGSNPFANCSQLETITVDSDNTVFDSRDNCNAIIRTASNSLISGCSNTVIPSGVTSIAAEAFYGCDIESIELPDGLIGIGDLAFAKCYNLTNIDIPDSLLYIDDRAFWGCSSLASIEFPDGLWRIGNGAFRGCSSLTNIDLPDSLTSLGAQAFMECSGLTSVEIPDGISEINSGVFGYCNNLVNVKIGDGATRIRGNAFGYCPKLSNVIIPSSMKYIYTNAFYDSGSSAYLRLYYKGTESQWDAISKDTGWDNNSTPTLIYNYTE